MRRVLARLGDVPPGEEDALGASLPSWRMFPRCAPRSRRREAAAGASRSSRTPTATSSRPSKVTIGVPFDETVVASEIGSYKPATRHWEEFYARTGADHGRHVHVAQSMFHDIVVAKELGLPTVWINRLGEHYDTTPTRELPDLERLPEALDDLVPA
jgi:hypothetical protein